MQQDRAVTDAFNLINGDDNNQHEKSHLMMHDMAQLAISSKSYIVRQVRKRTIET